MAWRRAIVISLALLLAAPATVGAGVASDSNTTYGVTQYQWLYYNSQYCGNATRFQIYRWEFRWKRIDTARNAKYQGRVGAEGLDCQNLYANWSGGPAVGTWYFACWGPCGNSTSPLWSRTQVYSFSNKPYIGEHPDVGWGGSWLDGRMLDTGGQQWGQICQRLVLFGSGYCGGL